MKSYVNIKMSQDINNEQVKEMEEILNSPKLLETTKELYRAVMYDIVTQGGLDKTQEKVNIEVDIGLEE